MLVKFEQRLVRISALVLTGMWLFAPGLSYAESSLLKNADRQISAKKYKSAVRTITKAMNSGNLSDAETATALYRRGVAYNKDGRSGSAIADLTGALWLEKLDRTARMDAYAQRAKAYEATGHKKQARRDYAKAGQSRTNFRSVAASRRPPSTAGISSFETVIKTVSAQESSAAKRPKPTSPQKPVIPAFRTSVATE